MKILGLLDTLESLILEGFKIPLTKKTIINEEQILTIIDKMRLVAQGGDDFGKPQVVEKREGTIEAAEAQAAEQAHQSKSEDVLSQAYQLAREIREGADNYADEVLSNLELTSTRILRTIKAGRDRLNQTVRNKEPNEKV